MFDTQEYNYVKIERRNRANGEYILFQSRIVNILHKITQNSDYSKALQKIFLSQKEITTSACDRIVGIVDTELFPVDPVPPLFNASSPSRERGQLHGHKRDVRTARSVRHRRLLRAVLVEQEEAMDAADQIEQLQDPLHNVRVSISTHEFDRAYRSTIINQQAEYDMRFRYIHGRSTASPPTEGLIDHVFGDTPRLRRYATSSAIHHVFGDTPRLRRYTTWAVKKYGWFIVEKRTPWNTCNDRWKPVDYEYRDHRMYARQDEVVDQKVHVMYTVLEKATKSSVYTNIPAKKSHCVYFLPDHRFFALFFRRLTCVAKHVKSKRKRRYEYEHFLSTTKRQNLIPIPEPTTWTWQEEEDEFEEEIIDDVVIVESPSRIVLVTALPQLFTRLAMVKTALHDHPTMPVHRQETALVLGRSFTNCIIAKELAEEEIGLFVQENCLLCADGWGRIRILFEEGDPPLQSDRSLASTSCGTCCMMMDSGALNEHERPFALSCGHVSCTGCWLRRVSDGMKRGEVSTTCPDSSCTQTLTITEAAALLVTTMPLKRRSFGNRRLRAAAGAVDCGALKDHLDHLELTLTSIPAHDCLSDASVAVWYARVAPRLPICPFPARHTTSTTASLIDTVSMSTDIFWSHVPSFIKKLAFDVRLSYIEERSGQPVGMLADAEEKGVLAALAHLAQMCALHSGKSRRCLALAQKIQFALHYFFDTKDRNRRNLLRKTDFIKMILKDFVHEFMRPDRTNHRYGVRPCRLGPSTITKEISPEGSCHRCIIQYGNYYGYESVNTAFRRPDPIGIDGFNVPYSLNKKKRWMLPATLVKDIEQLQKPSINLRVSVSMHEFDQAFHSMKEWSNELKYRLTRACYSVTRDGRVTQHVAPKEQQMMKALLHQWDDGAKPWRPRNQTWRGVHRVIDLREPRAYLNSDDEEDDQTLHVVYSVVDVPAKPSEYARLPPKKTAPRRDRTSRQRQKRIIEWESNDSDDEEDTTQEESTGPSHHQEPASLSSLIVPSKSPLVNSRRRKCRSSKKPSYVDESFRMLTKRQDLFRREEPTRWTWQEEEEEDEFEENIVEDIVMVESPSRIILVTPMPQLFTRIRLSESSLHDHPMLPVYPRSWEVHRGDTERVLGRDYPVCIIAKELNHDEIGLFAQENCLRCTEHWGRISILLEDDDNLSTQITPNQSTSSSCAVCCRTMHKGAVNELDRPFSLSCGHTSCTGCWLRRISDGIKKGDCPTRCPDASCPLQLSITVAAALLDSMSMRSYSEAVAEALLRQQKIARCVRCRRLRWVASSNTVVRCECGSVVCARCSSRAHQPVSCEIYHAYTEYIDTYGKRPMLTFFFDRIYLRSAGIAKPNESLPVVVESSGIRLSQHGLGYLVLLIHNPRSMELAFDARIAYTEAKTELDDRLQCLSIRARKEFSHVLAGLAHLAQMCYIHISVKSMRSQVLAQRIQFAMSFFFNTKDRNRRNLLHKTEFMKKILKDIEHELFL
uniref:RBR-type E3 ubiquitin transferase n=1 Tax=Pristionchus pacificus TaxID=54126 RepID=A0A8R1UAR5_PRIPA